ncbi:PREDICTED: aminopeptidase N-like, partial [Diuraphis noxia]|uniref:aminopeptidase N-like n=1 Tax=Diuraphis noxia TaxID=143948 RepID=UPI0007635D5B
NYMQRMMSSVYAKFQDMTVELNGFEEIVFKNLVTSHACYYKIENCTKQPLDLFRKWMKITDPDNDNILPKELKSVIYCQAMKYGGEDEWNFLWERYQRSNSNSEKDDMLVGLGCSSETWLLNRYLNWSLDNSTIRMQDANAVFSAIASNDVGFSLAKDFLYNNISVIYEFYQSSGKSVGSYVQIIGYQMKTNEELDEIQSFINKSSGYLKGADVIIVQTIKAIKMKIEWTSKYYDKIVNYIVQ